MTTRALLTLIAASAFTAHAQGEPISAPPMVAPPEQAPVGTCATTQECAPGYFCSGYQQLQDGKWTRGTCMPTEMGSSCAKASDCAPGLICTGHQDLGDGRWSRGVCQDRNAPAPRWSEPSRGPNSYERFRYEGTIPEGYHLVSEVKRSLIGGGAGALVGGYALTLFISLISQEWGGAVPVVGPLIFAVQAWQPSTAGGSLVNGFIVLGAIIELAAQGAGLGMIIGAVITPEQWLERDLPRVSLVPAAAGSPLGASLVGSF